jgi:peptidoglycan/xylan/chitin deacetylase (PgdA/CDA1 family)
VTDQPDMFLEALSPQVFTAQMEYLARYVTVLPLPEVVARLEAREGLPPWTVVVTLDDGYRDNYDYAFPILKDFGLPATIFLASDYIGTGGILWHDQVFSAFNTVTRPIYFLPEMDRQFDLRNGASLQEAQFLTLEVLRSLSEVNRDRRIQHLQDQLGSTRVCSDSLELMLQWDEVREMAQENISFGSHTVTHPILSMLPPDRAYQELSCSKKKLEEELGRTVDVFAYPNGSEKDFNPSIQDMVRDVGYRAALTTIYGVNTVETPRFALHRYTPWETDIGLFALKLNWSRLAH